MICSVLYELNGKNEDYLKIPLKKKKGSIIMRDWAKEIREDGEKTGEKNGEKKGMEKGIHPHFHVLPSRNCMVIEPPLVTVTKSRTAGIMF